MGKYEYIYSIYCNCNSINETVIVLLCAFIRRTDVLLGDQILYTEVRVGNADAGAITPTGHRICANALCKTSGGGPALPNQKDDCSGGPLLGRYVTVQRHLAFPDVTYPELVMAEIDVEFYQV